MARWDKKCRGFSWVREMIEADIETTEHCMKILSRLEQCCDELTPDSAQDWDWYDEFRDLKTEIHEEIGFMEGESYEDAVETVDGCLHDFYDLCDAARVWLGI